jgi:DNA helicase HerA-like ATPase
MSGASVFRREEFLNAKLALGDATIDLADYATTGIRAVAVGPSGVGKTNALLVMAEQLAEQGWISVLMDPEGDIEALYGAALRDVSKLQNTIRGRHHPIVVVRVHHADDFVLYGKAIMDVVDEERKPVFLMVDEGQIFSAPRKRKEAIGEASDLMNEFVERGRKRSLDLGVTAHRFSGTLHRSVFANKNLTLVGRQEDPTPGRRWRRSSRARTSASRSSPRSRPVSSSASAAAASRRSTCRWRRRSSRWR